MPATPNTRHTRLRRLRQRERTYLSPGTRSDLRTLLPSEFFGPSRSPGRLVILRRRHPHHQHHQHHHGASHKYHSRMSRSKGGVSLFPLSQRSLRHKLSTHRFSEFAFSFFSLHFIVIPPSHSRLLTHKSHTLSLSVSVSFFPLIFIPILPLRNVFTSLSLYYSPCCVVRN